MPTATDVILPFGPTARVRIEVITKGTGQDLTKPHKFGEPVDIPVQRIAGIQSVMFDDAVGGETEKWVEMEKGMDFSKLIREHGSQKKEIAELTKRIKQYERRLSALQLNQIEIDSKPETLPTTGSRKVMTDA